MWRLPVRFFAAMIRTRTAELQSQLSRTARDRLKMTPGGRMTSGGREGRVRNHRKHGVGVMYYLVVFSETSGVRKTLETIPAMLKSSVFEYDIRLCIGPAVDGIEQIEDSFHSALMGEEPGDSLCPPVDAASMDAGHAQCARRAAEYLDTNYTRDISVEEIAAALGVSRSFLSRCFKEVHGMTILEYLLGVRMKKALSLLDETDMSVNEIAARVGFNNANYFFRKFKEEFDVTPTQYRTEKTKH